MRLKIFSRFFFVIFLIFAKNIDREYTLEPPRRVPTIYVLENKKNRFYYIKVGIKGVFTARIPFSKRKFMKLIHTFKMFSKMAAHKVPECLLLEVTD